MPRQRNARAGGHLTRKQSLARAGRARATMRASRRPAFEPHIGQFRVFDVRTDPLFGPHYLRELEHLDFGGFWVLLIKFISFKKNWNIPEIWK